MLRNVVQYHGLAGCGGSHNAIPGSLNCGECRDSLEKQLTSEEGQYSMGVVRAKYSLSAPVILLACVKCENFLSS
jgi:hypothetical protein